MIPTVSVVIPCFNHAKYLGAAIDSVLAQTHVPEQVIVVDDGSTDNSADVAAGYGDPVSVVSRPNGGIAAARNSGIEVAGSTLLGFLDSDDLWAEDKLERQIGALEATPDLDCVFAHVAQFISPELPESVRRTIACPDEAMPGRLASAMLIRRDAFLKVGLFNESLAVAETLEWLARPEAQALRTLMLPDVLVRRRLHQTNSGIVQYDARADYARALKLSLDRRRQQQAMNAGDDA